MSSLAYNPSLTCGKFLRSNQFVRVIVGPIGSGKSSACVVEILRRAAEQKPDKKKVRNSRFAIIRNTYRELNDTTRRTFEQWLPPEMGKWDKQEFSFVIDKPLPDGTRLHIEVLFRALDRPEDVKKVLSLELTAAYFNELREVAKEVFDGVQGRVGRYPAKKDGGSSWDGIWGDSNPWHQGHWLQKLERDAPEGFEFFHQPGGRSQLAENLENLKTDYYKALCHGKDSEWIRVYIDGEIAVSDVGSIFGPLITAVEKRGGISDFAHPLTDVFTNFDIGISDAAAIWFWRINEHGVADIVDFYASSGKPLSHYLEVLEKKPYKYIKHWLPHDARNRTFATGASTLEIFQNHLRDKPEGHGSVAISPGLSIADGLAAARWHLEQPVRFHSRCDVPIPNDTGGDDHPSGLEAMREYKFEWDEVNKVFSKKPVHNWASNPADAFRYVSCVVKASELVVRKPPEPTKKVTMMTLPKMKLDELWSTAPNLNRNGRI